MALENSAKVVTFHVDGEFLNYLFALVDGIALLTNFMVCQGGTASFDRFQSVLHCILLNFKFCFSTMIAIITTALLSWCITIANCCQFNVNF
jgi:hypothetical protein